MIARAPSPPLLGITKWPIQRLSMIGVAIE
jgi:hypothetical protein